MNMDSKIYVAGHKGVAGAAILENLEKKRYRNVITREHKEMDLTDQQAVDSFFAAERPEIVFLAAAHAGGVVNRTQYPATTLLDNLQIETNVISSAQKYGAQKIQFMASSFIYPLQSAVPLLEESICTGMHDRREESYIISKIAGVKLCDAMRKQFGISCFSVAPCTFFGPYSSFDPITSGVIPGLVGRMHKAKIEKLPYVEIWGTGKPLREYLYSKDVADAMVFLMEHYEGGGIINLGNGGNEITIQESAEAIKKIVGYDGDIRNDTSKADGIYRRTLDSSKLQAMGWKPQYTFEEAVKETYEWFLSRPISENE